MKRIAVVGRGVVGLALVAGIMFAMAAPGGAVSRYARITIHKAVCPENTGDVFGECHDDRLGGVPFTVYNPTGHGTTRTTNSSGVASFGPRAGYNVVAESASALANYEGAYVYCKEQNSGKVLFDDLLSSGANAVAFTSWGGAVIICDWYNLTPKA